MINQLPIDYARQLREAMVDTFGHAMADAIADMLVTQDRMRRDDSPETRRAMIDAQAKFATQCRIEACLGD